MEGISSIHYAFKTSVLCHLERLDRIRLGHEIWVLSNSKVPFLLSATNKPGQPSKLGPSHTIRKCDGGTSVRRLIGRGEMDEVQVCSEAHECRRMIGDCFVYGVMV